MMPPNYREGDVKETDSFSWVAASCRDCKFERTWQNRSVCMRYHVIVGWSMICDDFEEEDRRDEWSRNHQDELTKEERERVKNNPPHDMIDLTLF
jgi:hypothetical protein